ncbi:MAG: prepilin-type N-terminal cleavage/methylation domain-containing protein [Candidatus Margulisiibacteriota bacterium]|jgi:prepilin-type N-terminal cleavage/methylation domain-containing protein
MKRGFTLIELLVVLGLLAVIMPVMLSILAGEIKSGDKVIARSLGQQAETILAWRIVSSLRGADKVNIIASNEAEITTDSLIFSYLYEGGIVKRRSGKSSQPLSNPGEIQGLTFRSIGSNTIEMTLNQRQVLICRE